MIDDDRAGIIVLLSASCLAQIEGSTKVLQTRPRPCHAVCVRIVYMYAVYMEAAYITIGWPRQAMS
jgi:hypothetical protein